MRDLGHALGLFVMFAMAAKSVTAAPAESDVIEIEDGTTMPRVLADEAEARRYGCVIAHLKDRDAPAAVKDAKFFHAHRLLIFDRDASGRFGLAEDWCYQDWYEMGGSRLVRLFDDGRDQIRIDALGNTGTGTLQKYRLYVGWCSGAWQILFAETMSYEVGSDIDRHFIETFTWEALRTAHPSVRVHLAYNEIRDGEPDMFPYTLEASWNERLTWHPETCSFYDLETEAERRDHASYPIQANVARVRLLAIDASPTTLCDQIGERTGLFSDDALMGVMEMLPPGTP